MNTDNEFDRQVKEAINHITKEMASKIYIDTDNVKKQARFEWDHSYEGFLHRKKIKETLNYIYGRENNMNVTMTIKEYKELCCLLEEIERGLWEQLDFARMEGVEEDKIKELEAVLDLIQRLTGRKGAKD